MKDPKSEVRQLAVNALAEYSGNREAQFVLRNTDVVPNLRSRLGDIEEIAKSALATYVNLAADEILATQMIRENTTTIITDLIRGEESTLQEQELGVRILQNLTRLELGGTTMLQCDKGAVQYQDMLRLLKLLFAAPDTTKYHPLYRVASVLQNCTQVSAGRQFLIDKQRNVIKELLVPLCNHRHPMVQAGVFGAIRNCMDDDVNHKWLLEEVDILGMLTKPLRAQIPITRARKEAEKSREEEEEDEDKEEPERGEAAKEANEEMLVLNVVEAIQFLGTIKENRFIIRGLDSALELSLLLRNIDAAIGPGPPLTEGESKTKDVIAMILKWLNDQDEVPDDPLFSEIPEDDCEDAEDVD